MLKNIVLMLIVSVLAFSCSSTKNASKEKARSEVNEVAVDQVLVKLKEGQNPSALIETFGKYDLKQVESVAVEQNIWLFSFDNTRVDLETLLEEISKNELVDSAQSNKKVSLRK